MFFRKSKAAGNDNHVEVPAEAEIPQSTIVALGTLINGNIDCEGDVQVDGRVRGSVRAGSLMVTAEGTIEGEATAEDVVVQGYVKGPVRARHIHLLPGALVEGNLTCTTVAIDTGARLSGTVRQEQPPHQDESLFLPEAEPSHVFTPAWDSGFRPLAAARSRISGR